MRRLKLFLDMFSCVTLTKAQSLRSTPAALRARSRDRALVRVTHVRRPENYEKRFANDQDIDIYVVEILTGNKATLASVP